MEEVAIHSSAVRNAFFDDRKKMEDVIPPVLLVTLDDRVEISPRKRVFTSEPEHVEEKAPAKKTSSKKAK